MIGELLRLLDGVITRLRRAMAVVPGATLFLQAVQDIRVGGRASNAQYQYTLQAPTVEELNEWTPKIAAALQRETSVLADVNSDQQNKGLESNLVIDRDAAARLGINVSQIDNTLYDAFGQRQVSTIFTQLNQYHVVLEADPSLQLTPEALQHIYVHAAPAGGAAGAAQPTGNAPATSTGMCSAMWRGSASPPALRPRKCWSRRSSTPLPRATR